MNYRQEFQDGCYSYGNKEMWPTPVLQWMGKCAVIEKEEAIAHREQMLERSATHIAFELWYRAHWEPTHILEAAPATGAMVEATPVSQS